jgi:eukaryotic-like serine/threonine-protein kinase
MSVENPPESGPFRPGYVFASRYRMVNRIGRGDRGEVWRADDLVLQTPVALKLVLSASRRMRDRILNEVRLARQVTHPAVCRVFDVGEAEDRVFYSMELVQGKDLATLLRRAGRLPYEKVVEIGRQLCGGLATAHAHGILHRALKPANVLVNEDGSVRMTDTGFGIADDDTGHYHPISAPEYLAPEQLTPGQPVSAQTDLYALGVILYELLTGERPFRGDRKRGLPPRPSTLVAGVPPELERAILQALAVDPRERPASAAAMEASLSSPLDQHRQRRAWLAGAAVAAVVGLVAMGSTWLPRGGRALTDTDTIVLADFMNTTGDAVFDGTLKVALAVALEQSPFLKVFPDDRIGETLRLMERPPNEPVTRSVAREIARREQLKALVTGSVGRLGSHYVLALEAVNAETGDVMARDQVEAASKEEVLTALGLATSRLREKLGESLSTIQKFDVPLQRATTASLAALHEYSLAYGDGRTLPGIGAIPNLKRAIELDPDFAMAQAMLSGVYFNLGQTAEAPAYSRRAFELRDRVSERERFFLSWRYYVDADQAWEKALDLARSWTATYPREPFAFNSLGLATAAFGQHEQAVAAFREATRLDARFVPPRRNLIGSLIALNRFDEAAALEKKAVADGIDSVGVRQMGYMLAFIADDPAAVARERAQGRDAADAMWSTHSEARMSAYLGQLDAAKDLFQRGVEAARRQGLQELAARWTVEGAESHAIVGRCGEVRRQVEAGLQMGRDNFTLERAARTLALCDARAESADLLAELATRFSSATITTHVQRPVIAAVLALRRGEPARVLELLDPVKPYDHAPAAEFWPAYLRGLASLQLKDGASAAVQFQSILDHRGEAPGSQLYALAHLGLARARQLTNDAAASRRAYDAVFAIWKGADSNLQPLLQARAEYGQLR